MPLLGKPAPSSKPDDLTSPLEGKSVPRILITIAVAIAVPGGLYLLAALVIAPVVVRHLLRKAQERADEGALEKALANANRAVKLSRGSASALAHRGLVHLERGDPRAALDDASQAIAKNEDVALSYYVRALVHDRAGDSAAARDGYRAYLGREVNGDETRMSHAQARLAELDG